MSTIAAQAARPAVIPSREEYLRLARDATLIPVYTEVIADTETPVSALLKLGTAPYRFILESVERGDRLGRYSFVGNTASLIFKSKGKKVFFGRPRGAGAGDGFEFAEREVEDPFEALRALFKAYRPAEVPGLPRFYGGAVGYLAYDMVRFFERLPDTKPDPVGAPDAYFIFTDTVLIFDHAQRTLKIVVNANVDADDPERSYDAAVARIEETLASLAGQSSPLAPLVLSRQNSQAPRLPEGLRSNFERAAFEDAVRACKEYIRAGDILQVVLSQRFEVPLRAKPIDLYRALRTVNPSPYMFCLEFPDLAVVGSSPEIMVQAENGVARVRPIAGTRPRGRTAEEDEALAKELLRDAKELAEHVMLVDLGRNDLGRVCEYGSVKVDEMMVVERYSHVMHIVSNVIGRLAPGRDPFDLLRATFPAGTVSGAPKVRAMEIIEELEPVRRGPYAGAIGYFGFSGNMDSCITIRTALIKDGTAYIQAGAGIVADSDPAREYEETLNKARAMLKAIALAEEAIAR